MPSVSEKVEKVELNVNSLLEIVENVIVSYVFRSVVEKSCVEKLVSDVVESCVNIVEIGSLVGVELVVNVDVLVEVEVLNVVNDEESNSVDSSLPVVGVK